MENYYKIAGLTVKMDTFGRTAAFALPYRIPPCPEPDITISCGYQVLKKLWPEADDDACEYIASGRVFYRNLLRFDGLMLHASAVAMDGKAYLFSGDSGAGKSTHAALWRQVFGDEQIRIINDDKPALRLEDGVWYAYGTPWSGKYGKNLNLRYPLGGICFLEQSEENEILPCTGKDAIFKLLKQTYRSNTPQLMEKTLSLVSGLLECVPLWQMRCNMEPEAAMLAYGAMSNHLGKDNHGEN